MKNIKKLFMIMCLFGTTMITHAQLRVLNGGRVSVASVHTPNSRLAVGGAGHESITAYVYGSTYSFLADRRGTPMGNMGYGVQGRSENMEGIFNMGVKALAWRLDNVEGSYGRAYGLYSQAGYATDGYVYGVFGNLLGTANGAAVYGSTTAGEYGQKMYNRYAGYFRGPVHVTGDLSVAGTISGVLLGSSSTSPMSGSLNASTINEEENASDKLSSLDLVTYNNIPSSMTRQSSQEEADTLEGTPEPMGTLELQSLTKQHYALDAEQLEDIYPDLVYENVDGSKSINYMELIPVLVQAINELSAKVEALEGYRASKQNSKKATSINTADGQVLSLGQNNPNPFSETTSIEVCVPDEITTATLFVYDMSGAQVEKIDINERGTTRVSFSGTGLKEGMYLYSLVADGRVVGTKKMILAK